MDVKPSLRLLDRVRNKIRVKHYSLRTEQAYLDWIKRFILFNGRGTRLSLVQVRLKRF
jgi:hypothetical protein